MNLILLTLLTFCFFPLVAQAQQDVSEQANELMELNTRNSTGASATAYGGKQNSLLKTSGRRAKANAAIDFKNRSELSLNIFSQEKGLSLVADNVLRAERTWYQKSNENLEIGADQDLTKNDWQILSLEDFLHLRPHERLSLDLGKKLTRWGVATLYNPIELLNQGKDLINPAQEDRQGNWQASAEVASEKFTATVLGVVGMRSSKHGIPEALNTAEHAFGLRLFTSLDGTDLSAVLYSTQKYQSAFEHKPWLGFAASHMATASTETHFEALFFQGSDRVQVNQECIQSQEAFGACLIASKSVTGTPQLGSKDFNTRLIVGTRTQFANDALLSIELLFLSDGDTQSEFNARLKLLEILNNAKPGSVLQPAENQPYSFKRKWYSSLQYQNFKLNDDLACSFPVLLNLEDFSAALSPRINYTPEQWLALSLFVTSFLDGTGDERSEFSLNPNSVITGFEARAYF